MDVLNQNGVSLLNYRQYYFKQPAGGPVREKISSAIHDLYAQRRIPETIFKEILDINITDSKFITDLQKYPEYRKSSAELTDRFDEIRSAVNDYLLRIGLIDNISTKNMIVQNTIAVIHTFDISKDVLISYFGLSLEELNMLMKRKGFMEKFCALRLSRVFQCIYTNVTAPSNVHHRYSKVYYNPTTQSFSVDYEYLMNIGYIQNANNMRTLLNRIQQMDIKITKQYKDMIDPAYFANNQLQPSSVLDSDIVGIEVPLRTGKKSQEIKNVRFFVDDVEQPADNAEAASNTPALTNEPEKTETPIEEKKETTDTPSDGKPVFNFTGFDDEETEEISKPTATPPAKPAQPTIQTKTGRQVANEAADNHNQKKKSSTNKSSHS